jgi:hypothetical protein
MPVAMTSRVLKLHRQHYYACVAAPVTDAEWVSGASGERDLRRPAILGAEAPLGALAAHDNRDWSRPRAERCR